METTELDETLAALADPQRRQAVELLGRGPRRAGELARALGLTAPAMSRHLRVLRRCSLVEEFHPESDARVRIYTLRPEPMAALRLWLEAMQEMWSEQMASFKAHVDGEAAEREKRPTNE